MSASGTQNVAVLGGGSWGTALAISAQESGHNVTLWARDSDVVAKLSAGEGNPKYLPGLKLPAIPATTDLSKISDADIILAVVPAQHSRDVFKAAASYIRAKTPVLLCSKGIERGSLKLMTEVLGEAIPHAEPAVLSGPSFAADVSRGLPTAVTMACKDEALGVHLMEAIGRPAFRPYWTNDLIGAEIGGAVKNVLAIACGMTLGIGAGRSAHAAVISRGFAEMTRLGVAMGAKAETLAGLCGLGDLVLTCSSEMSRNMSFGMALGKGQTAQEILASRDSVTEGYATAPALMKLARQYDVYMPISEAMDSILSGKQSPQDAITELQSRPFIRETESPARP